MSQILTLGNGLGPEICHQQCVFLLIKLSYLGPQAISRADFSYFIFAMWVRNHNLGTALEEEGMFGKQIFYPYISNVPVHTGPAWRLAWRQHITVTALIEPRINNVKKQIAQYYAPATAPRGVRECAIHYVFNPWALQLTN